MTQLPMVNQNSATRTRAAGFTTESKQVSKPPVTLDPSGGPGECSKSELCVNANMTFHSKREARLAARQLVRKEIPEASKKQQDAACHPLTQGMKADMIHDHEEAIVMATIVVGMAQTHSSHGTDPFLMKTSSSKKN